jgi:predicted dithiol-disulfide oxidoreductase (DUF899 family)
MNDYEIPMGKLKIANFKQDYNISFHNEGKTIGKLDFNGNQMKFTGDADESAKVFFEWLAKLFVGRLKEEREKEREACAKLCEDLHDCEPEPRPDDCATAIRARGAE